LTQPNLLSRPFESGEVTVQPYNTLLSMSSLVELSSGILLLQNEVLAATCSRLLGIKHPTFKVGAALFMAPSANG
jgi:tubulin delta